MCLPPMRPSGCPRRWDRASPRARCGSRLRVPRGRAGSPPAASRRPRAPRPPRSCSGDGRCLGDLVPLWAGSCVRPRSSRRSCLPPRSRRRPRPYPNSPPLLLLLGTLFAAEEGADPARDAGRRRGDLDHSPPDAACYHGGRLVELARHARHVPYGLVELGELAVYVVYGDVRLAEQWNDLPRDVLDRLLCGREDPRQPQEEPREDEERGGYPREEQPFHKLYEKFQTLAHLRPGQLETRIILVIARKMYRSYEPPTTPPPTTRSPSPV